MGREHKEGSEIAEHEAVSETNFSIRQRISDKGRMRAKPQEVKSNEAETETERNDKERTETTGGKKRNT